MPPVTVRVTPSVTELITPVPVRLPVFSVMFTPDWATMPLALTWRSFASVTVRLPVVMLAERLVTFVPRNELSRAVTLSQLAVTWLAPLSVMLPEEAFSATLPRPAVPLALMVPDPVKLPVATLMLIWPPLAETLPIARSS